MMKEKSFAKENTHHGQVCLLIEATKSDALQQQDAFVFDLSATGRAEKKPASVGVVRCDVITKRFASSNVSLRL